MIVFIALTILLMSMIVILCNRQKTKQIISIEESTERKTIAAHEMEMGEVKTDQE
jgi:hypothetical protein